MKQPNYNPWTLALLVGLVSFSGFMIGCGSSGGDSASGGSGVVQQCWGTNCTYPLPANAMMGFYAQTQNFVTPGYMNSGSKLQISSNGMRSLLREAMGVCDRSGISGGLADCSSWISGAHDMVLYSNTNSTSNTMRLIVRSVPGSQLGYGWYSYSFPNFKNFISGLFGGYNPQGVFDPMVLQTTIWPINNSQGFEVRSYGPRVSQAYNKLITLQVASGKFEDAKWDFVLKYNGVQAMSGTAVRCQSQNCGLDGSFFNNTALSN